MRRGDAFGLSAWSTAPTTNASCCRLRAPLWAERDEALGVERRRPRVPQQCARRARRGRHRSPWRSARMRVRCLRSRSTFAPVGRLEQLGVVAEVLRALAPLRAGRWTVRLLAPGEDSWQPRTYGKCGAATARARSRLARSPSGQCLTSASSPCSANDYVLRDQPHQQHHVNGTAWVARGRLTVVNAAPDRRSVVQLAAVLSPSRPRRARPRGCAATLSQRVVRGAACFEGIRRAPDADRPRLSGPCAPRRPRHRVGDTLLAQVAHRVGELLGRHLAHGVGDGRILA